MFEPGKHYFNTPNSPTFGVYIGEDFVRAKNGVIVLTPEQYAEVKKLLPSRPDLSSNMREIDVNAAYAIVDNHRASLGRMAESGPSTTDNPISRSIQAQRMLQTEEYANMTDEERKAAISEVLNPHREGAVEVAGNKNDTGELREYKQPEQIVNENTTELKTEGAVLPRAASPFGKLVN